MTGHVDCGEGGIRTRGDLRHTVFPGLRTRPTMRPLQEFVPLILPELYYHRELFFIVLFHYCEYAPPLFMQ